MKNIFVSSTFRDFHKERDLLRSDVLPEINRLARQYGETVNFCDLRWGIDTEEEFENATTKILSSCLNEIDKARPYMIVLLGDRYGFVPGEDAVAAEAKRRNLDLETLDISVTQLEIEYGVLQSGENAPQTRFYFREGAPEIHNSIPDDPKYREKLAELKKRISRIAGDRVRYYSFDPDNTEAFTEMVTNDLLASLKSEWEKNAGLSRYALDNMAQWNALEEKAACFCAHSAFADEIIAWFCTDRPNEFLTITGEGGAGKSTCFSHICVSMRTRGWDVIPFMGGTTQISTDEMEILRSFVWQMEDILGVAHLEEQHGFSAPVLTVAKLREHLQMLCSQYAATGQRLLLAVDAVDQLFCLRGLDYLLFLPEVGLNAISVLLTTRTDVPIPGHVVCKELPQLTEREKQEVIQSISQRQGRWLAPTVLQQVVLRKEAGNPLYLHLILNRLYLMDERDYTQIETSGGGMAHINQRQQEILQQLPDSKETFAVELLKHIIQTLGYGELWECMCCMGLSRTGLRSQDFEGLFARQGKQFIPYRFFKFINFLDGLFLQRNDGRYDFQHQVFRDGIRADMDAAVRDPLLRETAMHLLSLPQDDPVRIRELTNTLLEAGMNQELYRYIQSVQNIPEIAEFAQEDLYNLVQSNSEWMISRLREDSAECGAQYSFIKFFLHNVSRKFHSIREQKVLISDQLLAVREILMQRVEDLEAREDSEDDLRLRYLLAWCCTEIGRIYKGSADFEELQEGHKMLDQAYRICQDIYKSHPNETYCAMELALSMMEAGDFLHDLGPTEYQLQALQLYQGALELEEAVVDSDPDENYRRNLVLLYERISRYYLSEQLNVDTPKGFVYMQKGVEQMERIVQDAPTARNREELSNILSHLAQGHAERPGNDSMEQALSLYHRVLEIRSELYSEFHTPQYAADLCDAHMALGWMYRKCGTQPAQKAALEHCLRAYELAQKAFRSRQLLKDEKTMILLSRELGYTYMHMEGSENLSVARKYCKQALALADSYYQKNQNYSAISLFLRVIACAAEINLHADGEEALKESAELLEFSLRFLEDLCVQGRADKGMTKQMSDLYDRLGMVYEKLGGPEAQEKALAAYLRELELSKAEYEKDRNDVFSLRNLEVCENKIGHLLASMVHCDRAEEGLVYLAKALDTAKLLSDRYQSDQYLWDLSYCYKLNSKALMRTGRPDNLRKAKEYLLAAKAILENMAVKNATDESRRSLMLCCTDLSQVCVQLKHHQTALENAKTACDIADEILRHRNTGESVYEASAAYGDLAACLLGTNNIRSAQEALTKGISYAKDAIRMLGTYRAYLLCIRMHVNLGDLYLRSNKIPSAISAYDEAVQVVETYISGDIPESYRSMCVDLYMILVERYRQMPSADFHSKVIFLFRKSADILEPLYKAGGGKVIHRNLAHVYYQLGETYLAAGQYSDAIAYFDKYLQLYPEFDEEAQTDHWRILEYSCHSRIGVSYVMLDQVDTAIDCLHKAIDLQSRAVLALDRQRFLKKVLEDWRRDCSMLAEIYRTLGDKEQQLQFMETEISILKKLAEMDTSTYGHLLKEKTGALNQFRTVNKMKDDISLPVSEREAMLAYEDAEGEMVIGNTEKAILGFQYFQALASRLPQKRITGKISIYLYNSYSMVGAMLANRNTSDDRKQAIQIYRQAITYEMEALHKTRNPFRKKEILKDMAADSATLLRLCAMEGDSDTAFFLMEIMKDMR